MKKKQIVGIIIAAVVFVSVAVIGVATAQVMREEFANALSLSKSPEISQPTYENVAVINIKGTIMESSYDMFGNSASSYDHDSVMQLIEDMKNSELNKGLFLNIDSGGGAVYESDQVYRALMDYKETTERPIYAFSSHTMASGAYYIACAADKIFTNRNGQVGSIGVYIQTVNYAGLYEKLGIDGEFIKSGENKAMGNQFDALTDDQRAIYQSMVDEYYNRFLSIVCESRGYTREQALPICDGRIYTAEQGLAAGLIDDADSDYEKALDEFKALCKVDFAYNRSSSYSSWTSLFSSVFNRAGKTETEQTLELIENSESGVPMYYAG